MTSRLCSLGNGPMKSIAICSHGAAGNYLRDIGSGADGALTNVHPLHFFTNASMFSSIFGHHSFARRRFFITDIPGCPSCASCIDLSYKLFGITILVLRSSISPVKQNSVAKFLYGAHSVLVQSSLLIASFTAWIDISAIRFSHSYITRTWKPNFNHCHVPYLMGLLCLPTINVD